VTKVGEEKKTEYRRQKTEEEVPELAKRQKHNHESTLRQCSGQAKGRKHEKDRVVGQPTVAATDKDLMTSRLLKNTIKPSLPRRRESRTS
jgi:hypothetical protein